MWVLLGSVFAASLLGSLHCVGMCGPFAMLASSSEERKSVLAPTAAYSLGRLSTYSLVGVVFGSLGMALNQSIAAVGGVSLSSIQQIATMAAGGLMIAVGVIALARQLGWRVHLPNGFRWLQTILKNGFGVVRKQPRIRKAFLIGALSCLMPCGWLYTFAIVAAGTGSPWMGGLTMISFWAGTVPIMVALMLGAGKLGSAFQQKVPVAMAILVILIGCFTIFYRAPVAIGGDLTVVDQKDALIQQVQSVDHEELPCCSGK